MDQAKAKEIFSDETFMTSLLKIETPEEVQKALKTRGLEVSLDEIKAIGAMLAKGGELSEDDLEKVAGGTALQEFHDTIINYRIKDDRPWYKKW
jgi:predicted ribosomally synthesized peptide with nif11-like leader